VPGASVAVLAGGDVVEPASGVLNVDTGVDVTTDTVFQIGSITKTYTATLVLRLVEDGLLALDRPILDYLPEFQVADPDVTKLVTSRHLLAHTSGIDGDHFYDTGRGDDCLERYVESCAQLAQNHPLGATMSYCNSGYSILGRLVEKVTGQTWDAALRERLLAPLGLTHSVTLPEEALLFRTAVGHVGEPGEPPKVAPVWGLMRSCGPAGLVCATAADVLAFARLHLDGGVTADGTRLLSAASVAAMREPQVRVPDRWTLGEHWGLGWILFGWQHDVFGHDGNTIGQSAYLRIVPGAGVALAVLTNGGAAGDLADELARELLAEQAGVQVPQRPRPPDEPVRFDPAGYAGTYERAGSRMEITAGENALDVALIPTGQLAELTADKEATHLAFVPVDPEQELFATQVPGSTTWTPAVFFSLPGGRRYLHLGARATPKTS
jgi:CubicO group peptidase (beta-lactamase class C family)